MGKDVVLCVNMKKEFTKSGRILEIEQLKKILKIPVFFIDANNKKEVIEVVKYCLNKNEKQTFEPTYFNSLPINEVMCMIKTHKENFSKKRNLIMEKMKIDQRDTYIPVVYFQRKKYVVYLLFVESSVLQSIHLLLRRISFIAWMTSYINRFSG